MAEQQTTPSGLPQGDAEALSQAQQEAIQQNLPGEGEVFLYDIGEGAQALAVVSGGQAYRLGFEYPDDWGGKTIGQMQTAKNQEYAQALGLDLNSLQTVNGADFVSNVGKPTNITNVNQFQSYITGSWGGTTATVPGNLAEAGIAPGQPAQEQALTDQSQVQIASAGTSDAVTMTKMVNGQLKTATVAPGDVASREAQGWSVSSGGMGDAAATASEIPFIEGLSDDQMSSIVGLINSGRAFNATDAANFAYATGQSDSSSFVGMSGTQALLSLTTGGALDGLSAPVDTAGETEGSVRVTDLSTDTDAFLADTSLQDILDLVSAPSEVDSKFDYQTVLNQILSTNTESNPDSFMAIINSIYNAGSAQQAQVENLQGQVLDKANELAQIPGRTLELEQEFGVNEKAARAQELADMINLKAMEFQAIAANIEAETITTERIAGRIGEQKRIMAAETAVLAAQHAMVSNQLQLANQMVQRALMLEFGAAEAELQALGMALEFATGNLDREQQKNLMVAQLMLDERNRMIASNERKQEVALRFMMEERNRLLKQEETRRMFAAQIALQERDRILAEQRQEKQLRYDLMTSIVGQNVPGDLNQKILNAGSFADALNLAAPYLQQQAAWEYRVVDSEGSYGWVNPQTQEVIPSSPGTPTPQEGGTYMNPVTVPGFNDWMSTLGTPTVMYGGSTRFENFHPGIDIAANSGKQLMPFKGGTVIEVGDTGDSGFGKYVKIQDDSGKVWQYSHLGSVNVSQGQRVNGSEGVRSVQSIGTIGNTGSTYSTSGGDGSHLDLRVYDMTQQQQSEPIDATAGQFSVSTYAQRMVESDKIITEVGGKFVGAGSLISGNKYFPNILKSDDRQRYEQAQRNFVNAVLRRESGAAIAESEFESASKQYFPQPGDSEAVLELKEQNRQTVIQGFINEAGPAFQGSQQQDPLGLMSVDPLGIL